MGIPQTFVYWYFSNAYAGIIMGMGLANEKRHYYIIPLVIGWAHTQNDPCISLYAAGAIYNMDHSKVIIWYTYYEHELFHLLAVNSQLYWHMDIYTLWFYQSLINKEINVVQTDEYSFGQRWSLFLLSSASTEYSIETLWPFHESAWIWDVFYEINSLWPCDVIWLHRSGSTLALIMVCCLTAPSPCLNEDWHLNNGVPCHSHDSNFTGSA